MTTVSRIFDGRSRATSRVVVPASSAIVVSSLMSCDRGARDCPLLVDHLAHPDREVRACPIHAATGAVRHDADTAADRADFPFRGQTLEVSPDRHGGHAELFAQLGDREMASLLHELEDACAPFVCGSVSKRLSGHCRPLDRASPLNCCHCPTLCTHVNKIELLDVNFLLTSPKRGSVTPPSPVGLPISHAHGQRGRLSWPGVIHRGQLTGRTSPSAGRIGACDRRQGARPAGRRTSRS